MSIPYSPLIPESLVRYYQRMVRAFRAPASPDAVAIGDLSRIVELHHGVAAAITAALELIAPEEREQLRNLGQEQVRLARAVGGFITELGGSPPNGQESSLELPRDPSAMTYAKSQTELMCYVQENLDHVAAARRELATHVEIPIGIRERLEAQSHPGSV